jgi:predicted N-acyltransferase
MEIAARPRPAAAVSVSVLQGGAAAVPEAEWDRLARRGFHRHHWFVAAEAEAYLRPCHVAMHRAGELAAVFPAYLESAALHGDLHDRWFGPARHLSAALGLTLRPTLTVTPPFASGSAPLAPADSVTPQLLHAVFDRMEDSAATLGAEAIIWPYLTPDEQWILHVGSERGYQRVFVGSTAALEVEWGSFEEYLASRSKNVRRTIRQELKRLDEAGIRLEARQEFADLADTVDALYRQAYRRRNTHAPQLPPRWFAGLAERPHPSCWVQLAWKRADLVGVSVMLEGGGVVDGGFAGFATWDKAGPPYFADLIYEPLRRACGAGVRRIELGPGALYPKRLRGAVLRPRFAIVLGRTRRAKAILRGLGPLFSWRNSAKERRALAAVTPQS